MAMAGLVATAQQVTDFTKEWERSLRATTPGRIAYFKMDEAMSLSGEFQHWSNENRDAKIRQMANVIDREDLFLLGAVLDVQAHDTILRCVWKRKKADNRNSLVHPYMMLCDEMLAAAVKYGVDHKVNERMHVCYDNHAKYGPMFADAYRDYVAGLDDAPDWAAVMPFQPTFSDDKERVLLQAADMLAGDARLAPVDDKPDPLREGLCPKLKINGRYHVINEGLLRELDAHMRRSIREREGPDAWLPPASEFSRAVNALRWDDAGIRRDGRSWSATGASRRSADGEAGGVTQDAREAVGSHVARGCDVALRAGAVGSAACRRQRPGARKECPFRLAGVSPEDR